MRIPLCVGGPEWTVPGSPHDHQRTTSVHGILLLDNYVFESMLEGDRASPKDLDPALGI